MKSIRLLLTLVSAIMLFAGYLGSQYFYFTGRASIWAARMDEPQIRLLAALILLLAIAFSLIPNRDEETP